MKIISNFKDYYDHQAFVYGIDETRVWKRLKDPSEIEHSKRNRWLECIPERKNALEKPLIIDNCDLWFCDQRYPFLDVRYGEQYYNNEQRDYFWSLEDMLCKYVAMGCFSDWQLNALKEHFSPDSSEKLNTVYDSAQLLHSVRYITRNIKMRDYGFQNVVSSEQAFQRISMWLSAKPDVPQTIPTDLDRFAATHDVAAKAVKVATESMPILSSRKND